MQGKKTKLSYNMHLFFTLFAQRLIFPNPSFVLRYSAVIGPIGQFHLKQCLWAQCCFVYSVTRETAISNV